MRASLLTPLSTLLLAGTGLAGSTSLQAIGAVASNSLSGGPLQNAVPGDPVVMTFDVFTPGNPIVPGQMEAYTIDGPTMSIDVNGAVLGSSSTTLVINLIDDMPVSDGLRTFFSPGNLENGYGLGFELGLIGSTFDSTDITEQVGVITLANITSYSWEIHGGGSMYIDFTQIEIFASDIGTSYCSGDGTATACPCGNTGGPGEGCANTTGSGAILGGTGTASVSSDDVFFTGSGLLPGQGALLFVGQSAVNGGMGIHFGDGLRCAGGGITRLGVKIPDSAGEAVWGPGLGSYGAWAAGDTRFFQVWYRDPGGSPCSSEQNTSNGLEITFEP